MGSLSQLDKARVVAMTSTNNKVLSTIETKFIFEILNLVPLYIEVETRFQLTLAPTGVDAKVCFLQRL